MRLTRDTVVDYLRSKGVVPGGSEATGEPLGGGVSNLVFRVEWDDDAVVVKQPLSDLAVEDDWPADVDRVHNEAAAARAYAEVVAARENDHDAAEDARIEIPDIRYEDRDDHVIVISAAPAGVDTWKAALLDGVVDQRVPPAVGAFLAAAHDGAAGDESIARQFATEKPFEQLRLDPYHRTVAERHPDVAPFVEREIERVSTTRSTLVHGDYSPKNVLVDGTTDPQTLWLLDFEVAHWGDPVFDVAFMCNHLFIKSVYRASQCEEYLAAAEAFWTAYDDARTEVRVDQPDVVRELGVLMLARVDGKSPVEYVERAETKDALRATAKRLLREEVGTISDVAGVVRSEVSDA